MPQVALVLLFLTKPRELKLFFSPSKLWLLKLKVVAMVPLLSNRYDSTGLWAPFSKGVGILAITYQSPIKRGNST